MLLSVNIRETQVVEDKTNGVDLRELAARLNETDMSAIDFDALVEGLDRAGEQLESIETLRRDHALLRDDYQGRIAGMVKAMAAVGRSQDGVEAAAALIAELPGLAAEELVQTYRRTCVRFRDHFPTSYGPRSGSVRSLPASAVNLFR